MKVRYRNWRGHVVETTLAVLVEAELCSVDRDGAAERAREMTEQTARFLGGLVDVLVDKGVLTLAEVKALGLAELVLPGKDEG
jgi:hypothetical protein